MIQAWALIFAMTYLTELPVYQALWRGRIPLRWGLLCCLVLNLATHPIVWFLLPKLIDKQVTYVLAAEGFAVLVEAALLHAVAYRRRWEAWPLLSSIGAAFLANAFSVLFGETIGFALLSYLGVL